MPSSEGASIPARCLVVSHRRGKAPVSGINVGGNVRSDEEVYRDRVIFGQPAEIDMGLFKAGRGPRGFKYKPRFYDPEEDDDRELKRRMRARGRGRERKSSLSLVVLIGLLLLTLFLYTSL